jgi:hypothetical protein
MKKTMKHISLGSAYWGWSVSENEAYEILDLFYGNGGRFIDTAFNYPISSITTDLNKSFVILSNWIKINKVNDLKINYKIGSISNSLIAKNNTSEKYLRDQLNYALDVSGSNIYSIMIHWDNSKSVNKINNTCVFLKKIQDTKIRVGLSGIKYPKMYAESMSSLNFSSIDFQVKSNFVHSNLNHYKLFDSNINRFWAYGISLGGLKIKDIYANNYSLNPKHRLVTQSIADKIKTDMNKYKFNSFYELSMATAEKNDSLYGYIIGPSNKFQMKDIIKFLDSKF